MNYRICVVGLGYVGLPLARLFSTKYETIGFDMNQQRVDMLNAAHDSTLEVPDELLKEAINRYNFKCTTNIDDIRNCNFYIVAVPTPVDVNNRPDLKPLLNASETVGKVIKKGDIIVYESTVYPGVTEEECIPIVEVVSGLDFNIDFFVGYSPERINPGDKDHTVETIKKVTSGSTPQVADIIDKVYSSILINGTYKASSIKVAEASKIIENSQRDVNIAFMNELAKIFNAMGIDTNDVIEAASTKWNFIKLKPGLVGGHCISVDPYYLIQKAQVYGVLPRVMSAARRLNDGMGDYVASQVIKLMNKKAAEIGCTNTHFATPNGLDAGYNHYTTASDLAKIAQYAIKKPMFRKLVSTGYYSFSNLNTGRSYSIGTTNALLGNVPGVQGMKTGYTNKAGYCFVGLSYSARGNTYISVVLGADSSSARWQDSRTLLTYAYNH